MSTSINGVASESSETSEPLIRWEKCFTLWINFTHRHGCIPVKYHPSHQTFKITSNKLVYYLWFARIFLLTIDNVHQLSQFQYVTPTTEDPKEFMNFYVHSITRIAACIIALAVAINLESTVKLINALFKTRLIWHKRKNFGIWSTPFSGSACRGFTKQVYIASIFAIVQPFFPLVLYFQNRYSRRYWPSQYLPRSLYDSWIVIALTVLNEFHLGSISMIVATYIAIFGVSLFVMMTFYTGQVTTKLKNVSKQRFHSEEFMQIPLLQYRSLLVLNRIGTDSFCKHILPCGVAGACLTIILGTSAIVKFNSNLPISILLNLAVAVVLIVIALIQVFHNGGAEVLHKSVKLKCLFMRTEHLSLYVRKFVKSCRDMRMYVGPFSYVKTSTFCNCMKFMLDQTITILFSVLG